MLAPDARGILEVLEEAERLLVMGHVRPDGDTSSSALALSRALRALGKEVTTCLVDGMPERTGFLPDAERVTRAPASGAPYDAAVVVDAASYARVGYPIREEALAPRLLNIDHHATNERYGDRNWVDATYPATAEMVFDLVEALEVPLDLELATQIFSGIATDTGYLKYEATRPRTLRVMARLMEAGADHAALYRVLFDETSLGHQRLLGRAQDRIRTCRDGCVAWTWVSHEDGAALGVHGPLASVAVGPLTRIRGVELCAAFELRESGDVIAEFRSRGDVPVDGLARDLGGGGHAKASGCTLPGPLERARDLVLARLGSMIPEERRCALGAGP